jgi:hypothetical protein
LACLDDAEQVSSSMMLKASALVGRSASGNGYQMPPRKARRGATSMLPVTAATSVMCQRMPARHGMASCGGVEGLPVFWSMRNGSSNSFFPSLRFDGPSCNTYHVDLDRIPR